VSTHTITNLVATWGYLAVFLFVAIESTGIPFPGETMLLTAAAYASTGNLAIPLVIAAAASGAIIGDNLGYVAGRTGGRGLALRYGRYVRLDEKKLDKAESFFRRHGDKTVFFGRWIAVLRAWAAFLAGLNRMHWAKFLFYNAAGGITWATIIGVLAFELGKNLTLLHRVVNVVGYGGLAVAILGVIGLYVLHRRRQRHAASLEGAGSAAHHDADPAGTP
jgi:membrane protein DedA with SNARE-associated domain